MKTGRYRYKKNCVRPGGRLADCQQVEDRSALVCQNLQELPPNQKLRNLVDLYKRDWRCCFCKRLTGFANLSFGEAINYAAAGKEFDGKSHNCHLRHPTRKSLTAGRTALSKQKRQLKNCITFDDLFSKVKCIVTKPRISGLGEMYFYDAALRIGAAHNGKPIWPDKVYLPRGAKTGAQNLNSALRLGLDFGNGTIEKRRLPPELQCLTAYEIEDFFCIFKEPLSHCQT